MPQILMLRKKKAAGDPYFANVSLLLHFDGPDTSTTFTDSSSNSLTITPAGNAQIDTAQSKFGGASGLFDGSGDYLTLPGSSTPLNVGTGDFTLELFVRFASVAGGQNIFLRGDAAYSGLLTNGTTLEWQKSGIGAILSGGTLSTGSFHYIAVKRSGTTMTLWLNGTQVASTTNSDSFDFSSWRIGRGQYNSDLNGWIDEFRLTKAVARDVSTVPTESFPDG